MKEDFSERLGMTPEEKKKTGSILDLIGTSENKQREVVMLPLDKVHPLHTFEHPFEKSLMLGIDELAENIKLNGVLQPILVWSDPSQPGDYEVLAGHRRRIASLKAELTVIPAEICPCDIETAKLIVTESNTGAREKIFRSELAKAYQMQMEALKQQGKRRDWTDLIDQNLWHSVPEDEIAPNARDIVATANGISPRSIADYVRLNDLIDLLAEWSDEERFSIKTAVQLSYLKAVEQQWVFEIAEENDLSITMHMAVELKKQSEAGSLSTQEDVKAVLKAEKQPSFKPYDSILKAIKKNCFQKLDFDQLQMIEERKEELEKKLSEEITNWLQTCV